MPTTKPADGFSVNSTDLFDFALPEVRPGEGPLPTPEPSYELMRAHALFLIRSGAVTEAGRTPNPEFFVLNAASTVVETD